MILWERHARYRRNKQPSQHNRQRIVTIEQQNILAFVGMLFEARIAAGPGVLVFCHRAGHDIAEFLEDARHNGCRSIISFGVAGGLSPDLRPGDWVIASRVMGIQSSYTTSFQLSRKLLELIPGAEYAPIAGVDAPVLDFAAKREFHRLIGASAVDMESHLVADFATSRHMEFAAVRVVIDPAHRRVPAAAVSGLRPDGSTDARSVLCELLRNPRDVPVLAQLAMDALKARSALLRVRRMLGPGLGLLSNSQDEGPTSLIPRPLA